MKHAWAGAVLAILAGVGLQGACSTAGSTAAGGAAGGAGKAGASGKAGAAGKGAAGKATAGTSAAGGAQGPREVVGGDCPVDNWTTPHVDLSWKQWVGFGCDAYFFVAPDPSALPPMEWSPCPTDTMGDVPGCEVLGTATTESYVGTKLGKPWTLRGDGTALLNVLRVFGKLPGDGIEGYGAVVEAETAKVVHAQTGAVHGDTFSVGIDWIEGDRYVGQFYPGGKPGDHGGFSGVSGSPPDFVWRGPTAGQTSSAWAGGSSHVFRQLQAIEAFPIPAGPPVVVFDGTSDPLPGFVWESAGDSLFVKVNAGGEAGVLSWSPNDGLRPLLRWSGLEHIATRFATDGTDLVWTEGVGPQSKAYVNETITWMTAPFSLDPAIVESTKRSLGANPTPGFGGGPTRMGVGCGYAATLWSTASDPQATEVKNGLAIVRLSDATRWHIVPKKQPFPLNGVGATCKHVYFRDPAGHPMRIAIDKLPPGGSLP